MMERRYPGGVTALAERATEAPGQPDPYVADSYFTDGVHLYRMIGWLSRHAETPLAELEDCRTLKCTLRSRADLARMGLALVRSGD